MPLQISHAVTIRTGDSGMKWRPTITITFANIGAGRSKVMDDSSVVRIRCEQQGRLASLILSIDLGIMMVE
jgi:nitrogen regulatory protein PII